MTGRLFFFFLTYFYTEFKSWGFSLNIDTGYLLRLLPGVDFLLMSPKKCWLWSPCTVKRVLQLQTIVMPHSSCCRFSDSYIVRVKAVVMTRDDSSGGWFPQEGGGISRVGVCKVMHPEGNGRSGFLIHGERQKDKLVMADVQRVG